MPPHHDMWPPFEERSANQLSSTIQAIPYLPLPENDTPEREQHVADENIFVTQWKKKAFDFNIHDAGLLTGTEELLFEDTHDDGFRVGLFPPGYLGGKGVVLLVPWSDDMGTIGVSIDPKDYRSDYQFHKRYPFTGPDGHTVKVELYPAVRDRLGAEQAIDRIARHHPWIKYHPLLEHLKQTLIGYPFFGDRHAFANSIEFSALVAQRDDSLGSYEVNELFQNLHSRTIKLLEAEKKPATYQLKALTKSLGLEMDARSSDTIEKLLTHLDQVIFDRIWEGFPPTKSCIDVLTRPRLNAPSKVRMGPNKFGYLFNGRTINSN